MDTRQRSALHMHYKDLVDQLILDEDFYAALQREKLFTDSMILDIKSQDRDRNRVYKMLELLKKRGPKAFDSFVTILKENFSWLADMLKKTYESKSFVHDQVSEREETTKKTTTSRSHSAGFTPTPEQTDNTRIKYSNSSSTSESQTVLLVEYHENKHQDRLDTFITRSKFKEFKSIGVSPIHTIAIPRNKQDVQRNPLKAISGYEKTDTVTHIMMPKTSDINCQNVTSGSYQIRPKSEYLINDAEEITTGNNHTGNENEVDEETTSASGIFHSSIRRASSTVINEIFEDWSSDDMSTLEDGAHNEQDARDIINVYRHIFETELAKARNEITKYDQAMNDVYFKLQQKTNEDDHIENDQENKVSWEKIHTQIDKLPKLALYSDKEKMIKECYQLFDETDQKKPLNFHILNLLDQKNTLQNRIKELIKELDVNDMSKHQQDMRIIQNLKHAKYTLQQEKARFLEKIRYLEDNYKKRDSLIVEREKQIQDLECRIKVLEQKQKNHIDGLCEDRYSLELCAVQVNNIPLANQDNVPKKQLRNRKYVKLELSMDKMSMCESVLGISSQQNTILALSISASSCYFTDNNWRPTICLKFDSET